MQKMLRKRLRGEERPESKIRQHYEIEVELADKLRHSSAVARQSLNMYATLYDELYRRVPHHQQLTCKQSAESTRRAVMWQYGLLKRFLNSNTVFLEIGPGDCSLSFAVSKKVKRVFAVDVSETITMHASYPDNFNLILSDGVSMNLPRESIDVAYSNQLMEHLHPDDARKQLQNIFNTLKPRGHYLCVTSNSVNGPWDISYYYDNEAKGFHLKEYTMCEMVNLFKEIGFVQLRSFIGARGVYVRFPVSPIILLEKSLSLLPARIRVRIGRLMMFKMILGIKIVGIK